jgi:hypothetical protein
MDITQPGWVRAISLVKSSIITTLIPVVWEVCSQYDTLTSAS